MSPSVYDLLESLTFLRGIPAAVMVLVAAYIAVVAWDLRPAVLALGVQYVVAGLLFVDLLDPRLAVVYVIAGVFVTVITFITAWQINWGRRPSSLTAEESALPDNTPARRIGLFTITDRDLLRLTLSSGVLVGALIIARSPSIILPGMSAEAAYLSTAAAGLMALGLVGLAVSTGPLPSGIGLLVFLNGFALYYSALDQAFVMAVVFAALQLIVAVATAYLAQARFLPVDSLE